MEKLYQVFISSTFVDLREERQELISALLELDCIPVGMEMFPAADEEQMSLIKRMIDKSDYYVVVIGGRYGSIEATTGLSYTQLEYQYAVDKGIPVMAFIHEEPEKLAANKTDTDAQKVEKLKQFRELVQRKLCRKWLNSGDLGGKVSRSLIAQIKSKPRSGWVRADEVPTAEASHEILALRKQLDEANAELAQLRSGPPAGTEHLAQGPDRVQLSVAYENAQETIETSWDDIFKSVAPLMIAEAGQQALRMNLEGFILGQLNKELGTPMKTELVNYISDETATSPDPSRGGKFLDYLQLSKILGQFKCLGLIKCTREDQEDNFWRLTPYGEKRYSELCAYHR